LQAQFYFWRTRLVAQQYHRLVARDRYICEKGRTGEAVLAGREGSLTKITTLFFDVGGVILTNGWDSVARRAAVSKFQLDSSEFERRHELANPAWERGEISLEEYLERTIFYNQRTFSPRGFADFMYAQSRLLPESLEFVRGIARSRQYLMAVINNEAAEINAYRIQRFGLRDIFAAFFSSCYVGLRKPDVGIYQMALRVMQRNADECIFVDDRAENVEGARKAGMNGIHFQNVAQFSSELKNLGVQVAGS
jgi:putative hydrolase of the HAD superfamily